MVVNEYDFEKTARAVYMMNDSSRQLYDGWEELKDFMVSMAYAYGKESNYFSTGGFVLTYYTGAGGERNVTASVSSYLANQYVELVTELVKELRQLAA
jgi:uncharacterized phage infection (PIP) family protein YhgE